MRRLIILIFFIAAFVKANSQEYVLADSVKINQLVNKARKINNAKDSTHYSDALSYLLQATRIAEDLQLKQHMYQCYTALAVIYEKMHMPRMKKKYVLKAKLLNVNYTLSDRTEIEKMQQELAAQQERYDLVSDQLEQTQEENASQKIDLEKQKKDNTAKDTAILMQQLETQRKAAENKLLLREKEVTDLKLKEEENARLRWIYASMFLFLLMLSVVFLYISKRNYGRKLAEQNQVIKAEKQKSDDLLHNILPHQTAQELKLNGKAKARLYDNVTVMFTDFKDFTQVSEQLSPTELVEEIDTFFQAFDHIIHNYHIEKIKTIGDAYLCVSGLPEPDAAHAEQIVMAARDIKKFVAERKEEFHKKGKLSFDIRIGIHSGPVVAGIVGFKKFAYDIWGDTVNTAARMESSGVVGKINISDTTYALVKDKFQCTPRGKIEAKHKGVVDMYIVEG
jgi:class 3 adenylate cyclase